MAVNVTDTRITVTDADTATGWTGGGSAGATVFVEAPNSYIATFNIATGQLYFTGTARNLSNTLLYVWANNFAQQGLWTAADPPNALHIGDGTNRISFKMAGSDRKVFAHLEQQAVDWDCLVLDGSQASVMNTNGFTVARAGTFASLNLNAITQFGADFTTLSKGLGGGVNVAVDIIRVGNDGIRITGGTTGDRGRFSEIVALDRSTLTGRAHGIIREYTQGLYGVQGPLNFGTTVSETSWFQDQNYTLVFENRDISNDKYYIAVNGTGTSETHFILDNGAISTAGPWVRMNFSSGSIDELRLTNNTFRGLSGSVQFATDSASLSHQITNNTFNRAGAISVGNVIFDDNLVAESLQVTVLSGSLKNTQIRRSVVGTDSGSLLWNVNLAPLGKLDGMVFERGTFTNHAIEFGPNTPSTITISGMEFIDYGAAETTTSPLYNNSGKALTINVVGTPVAPTVRNGTGASTTLIAGLVEITLSGLQLNTEIVVLDADTNEVLHSIENTDESGVWSFIESTETVVNIFIHNIQYEWLAITNFSIPGGDTTLPIEQRFDRNYSNPPGGP